jgi:hypothetical protein
MTDSGKARRSLEGEGLPILADGITKEIKMRMKKREIFDLAVASVLFLTVGACKGNMNFWDHDREIAATRTKYGSMTAWSHGDVILLAGQSNMVRFSQYGLQSFAQDYAKKYGAGSAVEFVPCAVGGTYSAQWLPGQPLFDQCLADAHGKKVTMVLYYQGESDAALKTQDWGYCFGLTIAGFRRAFGNVPVVFAQIAITTDPGFIQGWQSIQDQQARVSIPGVKMIVTKDVAALFDSVHLTPDTYPKIAQRFVDAMEK